MNRTPTRAAGLIATALLAACASRGTRDCDAIAGSGWTRVADAPAARAELLARANLPAAAEVLWYAGGPDRVLICEPANSLVNPGCGGSVGYPFERTAAGWVGRGVLLPLCDTGER